MEISVTLVIISVVSVLFLLWTKTRRAKGWPPGPPTVPFIGNLNVDMSNIIQEFRRCRRQYGDVFSLILGSKTVVAVNGLDNLREVFIKNADVVSDRADTIVARDLMKRLGIIASSGTLWKEHRTFVLSTLRDFGFGKRRMEGNIMEEVEVFVECLKKTKGKSFNLDALLHISVSNIICSVALGKRFEHNDRALIDLTNAISESFRIGTRGVTFLPILKYIPGDPTRYSKVVENNAKLARYIQLIIDERMRIPVSDTPTNYLDAYLKHQRDFNNENSTFTYAMLLRTLMDLFIAGTETTATILRWFILVMLHKPDIQQRMREEILLNIGDSRLPSLSDREKIPYSDAVLHETLRFGNISPLSVPHGLNRDLQFKGLTIPKDAILFPCLDSVLNDPELFENPSEFQPSRFLTKDGSLAGTEKVVAFSLGRRVCLGESLARMELFLFATTLIQRFRLLPPEGDSLPSITEYNFGNTRSPKPYKFRVVAAD